MKDIEGVGRQERIAAAFVACRGLLARLVGRIVRPHDIEDIVQETFIRSFEAARTTEIRHPRSFMLKTARNLALNHISRSDQRLTDQVEDFAALDVYLPTEVVESVVEANEQFLLFCRAVRELPLQCRRAFLLKKVYGFSQKEVAAFLGLSESTVEKHVARGLLMCSDYLATHGDRREFGRKAGATPRKAQTGK